MRAGLSRASLELSQVQVQVHLWREMMMHVLASPVGVPIPRGALLLSCFTSGANILRVSCREVGIKRGGRSKSKRAKEDDVDAVTEAER